MAFFEWKDSYSTTIPTIDTQHKKLVEYINQLYETMSAGKSKEVMGPILQNLLDYTITHFSTEEKLLEKYNYPTFTAHKAYHDGFTSKIKSSQEKYLAGSSSVVIELSKYLKEWLANHILQTDMQYVKFLRDNKIIS